MNKVASSEGPDLHLNAEKLWFTRQLFIFKTSSMWTASSVEVVPQVQGEASRFKPATHSYTRAVTELVHFILVSAEPSFAVVSPFKSKNKTLPGAVELFTDLPSIEAKTPELEAIIVLYYYQSNVFPFTSGKKGVHRNAMVRNSIQQIQITTPKHSWHLWRQIRELVVI